MNFFQGKTERGNVACSLCWALRGIALGSAHSFLRIAYHLVGLMNISPNLSELGVLEVVPLVEVLNVSVIDKLSKDKLRSWGFPPSYTVLSGWGLWLVSAFPTFFRWGYFLTCLMCRSHLASFWVSFREFIHIWLYIGVFLGGGELRSHPHLVNSSVFELWVIWKNITEGMHPSHHSILEN